MFGSGTALDITPEVVRQEREIHAKWSHKPAYAPVTVDVDIEDTDDQPPPYAETEADNQRVSGSVPQSSTSVGSVSGVSGVSASVDTGLTQAAQRIPPPLPPRKGAVGAVESHMPGEF